MSNKIGLEKEFFLIGPDGQLVVIPRNLPADDCGFLVEARGRPMSNIVDAVFSLDAATYRIERQLPDGYHMFDDPFMRVSRDVREEARRHYEKGLTTYQNLYGHRRHRNSTVEHTAGVHISFSRPTIFRHEGWHTEALINWDWPSLFRKLDEAFEEEIKESKRRPGFYEVKDGGRVEYRSLPANVRLRKVMEVLSKLGW